LTGGEEAHDVFLLDAGGCGVEGCVGCVGVGYPLFCWGG
jgi:hypothetical protein